METIGNLLQSGASIRSGLIARIASGVTSMPGPRRILNQITASLAIFSTVSGSQSKKSVFVDTDLFSDVDDAAALLLACTLPESSLLAVNVNVNSTYSALAASAIVNHYGHGTVPIGVPRPYANTSFHDTWAFEFGEYASKVAFHWSGGTVPWFEVERTWDPVELYRKTLAEAPNNSLTIVSVGFLENISGLLNSTADQYSELNGHELVEAKVEKLAVMGGEYPAGHEFNFWGGNASYTAHVVNTWPDSVPVTFLGLELGMLVSTGARLSLEAPDKDPVKAAYQWYLGYNRSRYSWDPLTVVYAIRGLGEWFDYAGEGGYNYVFKNGSNVWRDGGKGNQRYLKLKGDNLTVATELEDLYLKGMNKFQT